MTSGNVGLLALSVSYLLALGCGSGGQTGDEWADNEYTREIRGTAQRLVANDADSAQASADNQDFAWRLFALESDSVQNTVFSPYSISVAAAMLSAGAVGETLSEMQTALGFSTEGDAFHGAHNALQQQLESRNREATAESNNQDSQNAQSLRVSNDVWVLPDNLPKEAFLNTLSANYGAGVQLTRFNEEPEASRLAINEKVANDTEQLIDELLPPNSITSKVAMVLTNAVYFKANWLTKFAEAGTQPDAFENNAGETIATDFMTTETSFRVNRTDNYSAISLPYSGNELELVAIMPTQGTFEAFVQGLNATSVDSIVNDLEESRIRLSFPKFEIKASLPLKDQLIELGMVRAFDENLADFSNVLPGTFIDKVFHDAKIIVNEKGTEAAAATAFISIPSSIPPPGTPIEFNHPFVFLIRDIETNATLFVGQFVQPD